MRKRFFLSEVEWRGMVKFGRRTCKLNGCWKDEDRVEYQKMAGEEP